ncbi:MAG: peptide chain release factor N(5)-glutamine methyltransferase [Planctomycetota bacterium]
MSAPPSPKTAGEMLRMARDFLTRKEIEEARLEGELLVAHALGLTRLQLFMALDRPVDGAEVDRARDLLVRRGRREPTAYIVGLREFYGRGFRVGPGVLIPRPETELLVDRAREIARERAGQALWIADLGTGSGCIAATLVLEIEGARVLAVDVSAAALAIARENARVLGADVTFEEGDGFDVLVRAALREKRGFDLVVSNPPYIGAAERASLAPEVREHEPELALFAQDGDPDHWVTRFFERARELLAPHGRLLVELGAGQATRVRDLAARHDFTATFRRDLAGIERVLEASPNSP